MIVLVDTALVGDEEMAVPARGRHASRWWPLDDCTGQYPSIQAQTVREPPTVTG